MKLANLVEDGVMAREAIQGGFVDVDGQVETRRGKQLKTGQVITVHFDDGDETVQVVSAP